MVEPEMPSLPFEFIQFFVKTNIQIKHTNKKLVTIVLSGVLQSLCQASFYMPIPSSHVKSMSIWLDRSAEWRFCSPEEFAKLLCALVFSAKIALNE